MSFQNYFQSGSSNIKDIYDTESDYDDVFYNKYSSFFNTKEEPRSFNVENILGLPSFSNTKSYNFISYQNNSDKNLLSTDIETLLKQEGITIINGKKIKFGNKNLRTNGNPNSHHREKDQYTGFANARDISIVNGEIADYEALRQILLNNQNIVNWMSAKGWGIINEITPEILNKTNGTGLHFHFGPDRWAVRTWKKWLEDPNLPVTQLV